MGNDILEMRELMPNRLIQINTHTITSATSHVTLHATININQRAGPCTLLAIWWTVASAYTSDAVYIHHYCDNAHSTVVSVPRQKQCGSTS